MNASIYEVIESLESWWYPCPMQNSRYGIMYEYGMTRKVPSHRVILGWTLFSPKMNLSRRTMRCAKVCGDSPKRPLHDRIVKFSTLIPN